MPWLFDWTYLEAHPDFNKTFDVALHVGTLVAVVAYFWRELGELIVAWWRSVRARAVRTADERVAWIVIIATIPAALAGAVGESFIEKRLGEPWQIAIFLALGALLLYLADRRPTDRAIEDLGYGRGFSLGLAQTLALAPGVSRSGHRHHRRALPPPRPRLRGADLVLPAVPVVFGAALFKGLNDVVLGGGLPPGSGGPFVVGMLTAAATGLAAIWILLGYVRRHTYTVFVVYRLVVAAIILLLIATGARPSTF